MAKRRDEVTWFLTASEWRDWLVANHDTVTEIWLGCRKQHHPEGILVSQAIEEALCFGWIDSVRNGVDADGFAQRFSPRTSRSPWSEVNRALMEELIASGRVHPAGLRAWDGRDAAPGGIAPRVADRQAALEAPMQVRFEADPVAWNWFQQQPPGYRRLAIWWVMDAKRAETRERRLTTLIDESASQRRIRNLS